MTRDQILAMEAGPELDALVAERVLGCKIVRQRSAVAVFGPEFPQDYPACGCKEDGMALDGPHGSRFSGLHNYSSDIAAAWKVVEHLPALKPGDDNSIGFAVRRECDGYRAGYMDLEPYEGESFTYCVSRPGRVEFGVPAPTAPLAICRAALIAEIAE